MDFRNFLIPYIFEVKESIYVSQYNKATMFGSPPEDQIFKPAKLKLDLDFQGHPDMEVS